MAFIFSGLKGHVGIMGSAYFLWQNHLCYPLLCNKSPQNYQLKTIHIYYPAVSVVQNLTRLAGGLWQGSLMKMQSSCEQAVQPSLTA